MHVRAGLLACVAALAGGTAQAQFFFPFGQQPARRARPAPRRAAPLPVPLPVPRPRFAGNDARPAAPTLAAPEPPREAAQAAPAPAAAPQAAPGCLDRLRAARAEFAEVDIGPQPDARCQVAQPVRLSGLTLPDGSSVAFPDHPTLACVTADTFDGYVRDLLAPLVRGNYGTALAAVWTGPGLECRSRDHIFGAKLSAHGQGLAVDVAQLGLADRRRIEVGTPRTEAETGFETAARNAACGYFHTVLGPGSDSYHRTHWHFDLEVRGRGGDGKYCK